MRGRTGVVVSALIFLLVLVSPPPLQGAIPSTERQALVALYNSTGGASWTTRTNWRNGSDTDFNTVGTECTWYGVTCTADAVTSIVFVYNNLAGTVPAEIGQLSHLQTLRLSANLLSGTIPPEIGGLSDLEYLHLENNNSDPDHPTGLSGSIPTSLGNLSSLRELDLWDNRLDGSIPAELGNLSNLEKMHLYKNQLGGTIPPELGNLSALVELSLGENQIVGAIPVELGSLSNLTVLSLLKNQLTGEIPAELGNLPSLGSLILSGNQLTGTIPSELGNFPALLSLSLGRNRLIGTIPSELGNLLNLMQLDLASNQLSGDIPVELENLSNLYDGSGLSLGWNALHTDDSALIAFINSKSDGEWENNQTIPPVNLYVSPISDHSVWLHWSPVSYSSDPGGYELYVRETGTSAWIRQNTLASKASQSYPFSDLTPGTAYEFALRTYTDPHGFNANRVLSDLSTHVTGTTTNNGCSAPAVLVDRVAPGVDTWRLWMAQGFDSYSWSTGETTPEILVSPAEPSWYWVSTVVGSCHETAVVLVDLHLFNDGFEDGGSTAWSATTP